MSFLAELRRRNVIRVLIAYLAAAWFLIQIADTVVPAYGLPDTVVGILITVLAIGLIPVVIISWAFELTPEGLKRDADNAFLWMDKAVESGMRQVDVAQWDFRFKGLRDDPRWNAFWDEHWFTEEEFAAVELNIP